MGYNSSNTGGLMLKTHNCGELNKNHIGQQVSLAGWVHRRRDHGGLVFIDLRDRSGLVQVVFNPQASGDQHDIAGSLRLEFVLQVSGEVARRPEGTENPKLPTGEVEIIVRQAEVLNPAKTPPFDITEDNDVDENLRLRYRYLDLRRQRLQQNILLRHRVIKFMRDFLDARGFIEIETPILIKSTPEGARDYLVPSRVHTGRFYALPQSPQQLKQLLMVAGFERYFQIARCFRDEDLRADRQPEFTQLDLEMSFVDEEDILALMEDLFTVLVDSVKPEIQVVKPFPRLTYRQTMERFGTDKPDLRYGLEIKDISDIAAATDFGVFRTVLDAGGVVRGICAPGCGLKSVCTTSKEVPASWTAISAPPPPIQSTGLPSKVPKALASPSAPLSGICAAIFPLGPRPVILTTFFGTRPSLGRSSRLMT